MPKVTMDSRAVLIDDKRTLLISGAIHYPRSTPAMWPALLDLTCEAGLNCIETYVMWDGHEHSEGRYDFTGRYDLARFLQLCHDRDLYVILRPGPYICSEWNFGGFPPYLLDVPGIAIRTFNRPFMDRVRRWFRVLLAQVGDYQATHGGPIILAQVENEYKIIAKEYGNVGQQYLEWMADVAREVGIEVPLMMCEGAAPGILETFNNFTMHERVAAYRRKYPNSPILWTELWPGWYDVWGSRRHLRDAGEIAYSVLRFFAVGGAGVNYYMWHGGTNFERSAMYLQTTSYDFDAPIDEYGLPTTKLAVLARVHRALHAHANTLLNGKHQEPIVIRDGENEPELLIERWVAGRRALAFLINTADRDGSIEYKDGRYDLPPKSVLLLAEEGDRAEVACRSWRDEEIVVVERQFELRQDILGWEMIEEPLPSESPDPLRPSVVVEHPVSQLPLTHDDTDYCWYCCDIEAEQAGEAELEIRSGGDLLYIFVNGQFAAASPLPLQERRGSFDGPGYQHRFAIPVAEGRNRLAILAVAFGLIKGDWMIDDSMEKERKGLWGDVLLDGEALAGPWTMIPGLLGEVRRLWEPGPASLAPWKPIQPSENPLRWYRTEFTLSEEEMADLAPWAFDAEGLNKGFLWVNGHCLGRYWLIIGRDEVTDHLKNPLIQVGPAGVPTQRYYHIPREWLARDNDLVVFEEQGALPNEVHLVRRR
jgi:hypothetical protein